MITAPPLTDQAFGQVESRYALLINPFYPKDPNASFGKHVLTPSLALTSFAATTPATWRVEYWDENLLHGRPPCDPMPQVVGISVHLTFARRAYEIADWYRTRGAKVVLGGLHVLSCPDECVPHADALALGDGVQLWPQILRDAEAGQLKPKYLATYENSYEDDPAPSRSILPRRSFLTTSSIIATRGCHNRCGFCYLATDGLRMPYRMRRPEQVAAEFAANGEPYGVFIDNNLGSRKDYLHALCRALRPIEKIWDRHDVFATTAEWVEENRLECATFHILTPYPATPLFRQMEAEGRLLHRDWSLYDTSHAVFRPKHMSAEELEHGYAWIYRRLFSHASIWRRRPEDWRAVPPYLAMSYLYKRSNRLWNYLIKHDLVHAVWSPLVEITRQRHLRYRRGLLQETTPSVAGQVVSAGV